jgi:hypothetical protein
MSLADYLRDPHGPGRPAPPQRYRDLVAAGVYFSRQDSQRCVISHQ